MINHDETELGYVTSILKRPDLLDELILPMPAIERVFAKTVYQVMIGLYKGNRPIDYVSVAAASGGAITLSALVGAVDQYATSSVNTIRDHYDQLNLRYQVGKIRQIGEALVEDAKPGRDPELLIEFIEHSLLELTSKRVVETEPLKDIAERFAVDILSDKDRWERGLETRISDLNKRITGFMPSDYVVIAAPPRFGKTAFAFDACLYNAQFGVNSLYCALDQSKRSMVQRIFTAKTGLDKYKLMHVDHKFTDHEQGLISDASREISALKGTVFINDNASLSMTDIRSLARQYKRKHNIKLLVLDYIQQIRSVGRPENRTQEMTAISRQIKELGRELDIPIFALSQLARTYDGDCDPGTNKWPRPRLTMLRDSGAIEQDATLVLFLFNRAVILQERFGDQSTQYLKELGKNPDGIINAEVIISKHKDGESGSVRCKFDRVRTRFVTGTWEDDSANARPEPDQRTTWRGSSDV